MSVPRRLHQIFVGPSALSERDAAWCLQTKQMNEKSWAYKLHGNELLERYASDPYIRHMLARGSKYAFVVDRLRMLLLNDEGGIYVDSDAQPIKPLDTLNFWDSDWVDFVYGRRDPYRPGVALHRGISFVDNTFLASAKQGKLVKKLLDLWTPNEIEVNGHMVGCGILRHAGWDCLSLQPSIFYSMVPHPDALFLHDGQNAGSWVADKTPIPTVRKGETITLTHAQIQKP